MSNKVDKGRVFGFVLYADSASYSFDEVLADMKVYFNKWAYILHDLDVDFDTGELIKPHFHFYGYKSSGINLTTVVNRYTRLGVGVQHIEMLNSWKGSIQYLTHANHLEKVQYNPQDIVSNMPDILKFFNIKPEGLCVLDMIDLRLQGESYRSIILDCVKSGTYDYFRRNYGIIKDLVRDERLGVHSHIEDKFFRGM